MKKTIVLLAFLAFSFTKNNAQTVTDYDGNVYNTVTIGTQVWMKENLKVTHYRNGDSVPNVKGNSQWANLSTGAYCDYNNSPDSSNIYGRLYNWYVVNDSRNIAPIGWHIPTDPEWTTLINYLGGIILAGNKLKESGTTHWIIPNFGATNSSGFTALPGGFRDIGYSNLGHNSRMYSIAIDSTDSGWYITMSHLSSDVGKIKNNYKHCGISIRCLRDTPAQINDNNIQDDLEIYPNPAINKIYVNSTEKQDMKIQVFNTIGKCVLQTELNNTKNEIDISSLTKGIYILKIADSKGTFVKKIIKE